MPETVEQAQHVFLYSIFCAAFAIFQATLIAQAPNLKFRIFLSPLPKALKLPLLITLYVKELR